ncbi:ParB/RepB/Spo0J family partition protein [Candidatus Saccharibacteria bacterium]|nr:ParB/RepB/Spo0J family partition protein [Candidatus Saccharibacteria bacterium]MBQ6147544.1 ParB/RepB/Spo0J family partition protein [Candidatus Saccharibacteria bacterium]
MSLGRGFESLIPTDLVDEEFDPTVEEDGKVSKLVEISLEKIVRDKEQPRKDFSEASLSELADSIKKHGVLQPIVVTREEENYKIVAGERRWRAAKLAGLEKIPAIVRTLDAQNRLELSIIENAQREDLNAIELATAYAKLKSQFNLSVREIGERVGKSEQAVANTLRLLNLSEEAKKVMRENGLSEGVMRPLIGKDEREVQRVLGKIVKEGWTARKVEEYFKKERKKNQSSSVAIKLYEYEKRIEKLTEKFKLAKVKIDNKSVTLTCKTKAELDELLGFLTK